MRITDILSKANKPLISFELTPQERGKSIQELEPIIETLSKYNPPFIDVTSRASELVYQENGGTIKKLTMRKRPGTLPICMKIQERHSVPAVPHVLCNGFTTQETEDFLIELDYAGIENVLALKGDDLKYEKIIPPNRQVNNYAIDLVRQIKELNKGKYISGEGSSTKFCVGVAGYPEKHIRAPNAHYDIQRLKEKVDAGADYVVTQMFYDNNFFYKFVEECRSAGINVPIIPGLKIITTKNQLCVLPEKFHIDIPNSLVERVEKAQAIKGAVSDVGIDWARRQVDDLFSKPEYFKDGKRIVHLYVMGATKPVEQLMAHIYFGS